MAIARIETATPTDQLSASPFARTTLLPRAVFLGAAWIVFAAYVIHTRLPANPIYLPLEPALRPVLLTVVPEGWSFFTRDSRLPRVLVYRRTANGHWESASTGAYSEPRNAFGFSRQARAQGAELGMIAGHLPKDAWMDCPGDLQACLSAGAATSTISNASGAPTLCGVVAVIRQVPVPWAWSRSEVDEPSQYALVRVRC